jgi:hypothetical protein
MPVTAIIVQLAEQRRCQPAVSSHSELDRNPATQEAVVSTVASFYASSRSRVGDFSLINFD